MGSRGLLKNAPSIVPALDEFVFIKKGYSFWKHLIPFSMVALVLVVLSLPADNLLLKLTNKLAKPDWIWIPAISLTIVACLVYGSFLYVQVRQAYLWTDGSLRRSIVTALVYLLACAAMAYLVLQTALSASAVWGGIWACILVAALSLTGVGWSLPGSWVEAIGICIPDYTEARNRAKRLAEIVAKAGGSKYGERGHIQDFLKVAESLRDEIEKNKSVEPGWARPRLDVASADLAELIQQTKRYFPLEPDTRETRAAIERFASACKFEASENYRDFVPALQRLSAYWSDWKFAQRSST